MQITIRKLGTAVASAIALISLYKWVKKLLNPLSRMPSTPSYPFLLHLFHPLYFNKLKTKNSAQIHVHLTIEIAEKYGPIVNYDSPILGQRVLISKAEDAKRILTDQTNFVRGGLFEELFEGMIDHALFGYRTGHQWKRHRKLIQPAFGPSHLRHAGKMSLQTVAKLNHILKKKEGQVMNFITIFKSLTLDVISLVAFGYSFKAVEKLEDDIEWKWHELEELITNPMLFRGMLPKFLWKQANVANDSPNIVHAKKEIERLLDRLTEERLAKLDDNEGDMDVLHRLLIAKALEKDEIYGEILGFFIAGHETSSNTLSWILLELCRNPAIQEKLYNEIKNVDFSTGNLAETLDSLKYLDKVVKESQRLNTVATIILRETVDDVVIRGYHIPKNTGIIVNIAAIHQDPEYFPEPKKFNPDRWDDSLQQYYLPFGDGPHNCIGQKMALIEIKIVLSELVKKFRFSLEKGFIPVEAQFLTYGLEKLNVVVSSR
ncbi:hypothetical protein HK103_003523 [Boothiomyces macroporosus]|uniref:Cytochrome P450 n=1 Tax=Boothiomyces macroporosus TaxID=261099 RepID=A0AAD5UK89_9FUNG|nr:hypothetical protein HK103_003523 [Boothiomyces macroporosus]